MEFSSEEIEIGKKIRISRESNKDQEYFISQVLDIIDDENLIISGPIKKSRLILVHSKELLDIYYIVENKGIYSFTAKVLSRKRSPIYTLKVKRISEIKKTQQREHFRLFLKLDVKKIHEVTKDNEITIYEENCESKDISGGGMRLYCNYEHNIGDIIICKFKIKDFQVNLKAKIKRIDEIEILNNYRYSIGVSFEDLDDVDRDKIIRYIFEQQRILRNKGLI